MKWQPEMAIDADSFNKWVEEFKLFPDLEPAQPQSAGQQRIESKDKSFYYVHQLVDGATLIDTVYTNKKGVVVFTGPVVGPTLLEEKKSWQSFGENVWAGLMPFEWFTLRGGIRAAKGHTVVGGLGLGVQLIMISRKKTVKKVTVVERSKVIIDWLFPQIQPKLGSCEVEMVFGDAEKLVPKMSADVAVIDIFKSYGSNEFPRCPDIGRVWVWGSSVVGGSIWD